MASKLPASRAAAESAYGWDTEAPETDEDRSFLLPFGLEPSEDKTRRNSHMVRKKVYVVTGSIIVGMVLIGGLLGLGIYIAKRQDAVDPNHCPPRLRPLEPDDLVFFVIGDWGREGSPTQKRAAKTLYEVAAGCVQPQFIISTGDNFYPHGLSSGRDTAMQKSFTNVYNKDVLQVPWYAVLGNHDYGDTFELLGNPQACAAKPLEQCELRCCVSPLWQVTNSSVPNLSNQDERWHLEQGAYQRTFGDVQITFIDTSPLLSKYRTQSWASLPGGILAQNMTAQRERLDQLLSIPAKWKIVVGHHPVRSYGQHCRDSPDDCKEVSDWLMPLLHKHKVIAYMSGHEHDLQYIKMMDDPVNYIVSGAGSDIRTGEVGSLEGRVYIYDDQGFVAVHVRKDVMTFYYWTATFPDITIDVSVTPLT